MGKYLNPGNAGFTSIRKGKYIDKTELIAYINHTLGTKQKLTCVSRPGRFGKSFAVGGIIAMLGGAKCEIVPNTFQNDMTTFRSKDDVLALLAHLGHLSYDAFSECVFILNQEVREEFLCAIRNTDSPRACLKIHSRNLPPHFASNFMLNLVNVAHYTS